MFQQHCVVIVRFITKFDMSKIMKEGAIMTQENVLITQESVRAKLVKKTNSIRQHNISVSTGIPREIISKFMNGKRELHMESLQVLNEYLDQN